MKPKPAFQISRWPELLDNQGILARLLETFLSKIMAYRLIGKNYSYVAKYLTHAFPFVASSMMVFYSLYPSTAFADVRACLRLLLNSSSPAVSREYVDSRFDERAQFRERFLTQEVINSFQAQAISMRPQDVPGKAFEFYLSQRLKKYSAGFEKQIRQVLAKKLLFEDPSTSVGGQTISLSSSWLDKCINFFFGQSVTLGMAVNPALKNSSVYFSFLAHELGHVIQLKDTGKFGNISATQQTRYEAEFAAVLGEWEYWQLLPQSIVSESIALVRSLPIEDDEGKSAILNRLDRAHDSFVVFHMSTGYATPEAVEAFRSAASVQTIFGVATAKDCL